MKQSLKQYLRDIRNLFHVIVGISFGYALGFVMFGNRDKFPIEDGYYGNLLACLVVSIPIGIASFLWERHQDKITENSSDMRDVYVSMISGAVGGLLGMLWGNVFVSVIVCGISTVLIVKHYKK